MSKEAYYAIAEKSDESGVPFAGHIPNSITIWEAMEAGQKSFEHMYGILEGCSSEQDSLQLLIENKAPIEEKNEFLMRTFDQSRFDSLAITLATSGSWLSPTLTVLKSIANLDDTTRSEDPRLKYMPDEMVNDWDPRNDFRFQERPKKYYEVSRQKYDIMARLLADFEKAGVKIIAGTDYPNPYCYPGFSLHEELQLMVEGGMQPLAALKTATYNPALYLGMENEHGLVKERYMANLVILNNNPLMDIRNTKDIHGLFLNGKYFDRDGLDQLLQEGQRLAKDN